ncbi:TetR family transcriptional regulator [Nocardia asteroides]|uniref:TetR family transcriptional regulator n=1 Tax=Nocardia asteroides TaxID=1824 RepID=UPI001E57E50B|nr:TetR family transcriptional regulator [Nocardia asteroides]UGT61964.1 TetR family transcriptional regulator [Nocardia asteroides]
MSPEPVTLSEFLDRAATHRVADTDATAHRILDAAVAEAGAVGLDRVRMEDVVRRSALGRTTVYRRFPSREELVRALVARETERFLAAVTAGMDSVDRPSDRVVEAFLAAVSFARAHPMLRRMGESAPGSVLDLATTPGIEFLDTGTAFIARHLHGGRPGKPGRQARWVADVFARLFLTYLALPPLDPDVRNDTELRAFARAVLTPMAESAAPADATDKRVR